MAEKVKTIGSIGRFYSSPVTWAEQLDNTSIYDPGDTAKGVLYNDSIYDVSVDMDFGAISGITKRTLTVALGERHTGIANTGVIFKRTIGHDFVININTPITTFVEWVELDSNSLLNSSGSVIRMGTGLNTANRENMQIKNCIVHAGTSSNRFLRGISSNTRPFTAIRNIVYSIKGDGVGTSRHHGIGADDKVTLINNTVANISSSTSFVEGIEFPSSVDHVNQNNICIDVTNSAAGTSDCFSPITPAVGQVLNHNLSSDTTAVGTGSLANVATTIFQSTVPGSEDYHLVNASVAKDAGEIIGTTPDGVDLSMPTTGFPDGLNLTTDFQGTSWDMGACEFLAIDSGDPGVLPLAVTDDMVVISNADVLDGWITVDDTGGEALEPDVKVQGINSVRARVNGVAVVSGLHFDVGVGLIDLLNKHLYCWGFTMQLVDTKVLGGWRFRVSSSIDGSTNYGEWFVGGNDTVVGANTNFQSFVIDTSRAFDAQSGTPPALTAVRIVSMTCKFLTSNGRISLFLDDLKHGTGITAKHGTDATPGTFVTVATDDKTTGRGIVTSVGGVFYVTGSVIVGNNTAGGHVFKDSNFVVIFENHPVSATHYQMVFEGNTTGFGDIVFGSLIGTGNSSVGVGGGLFKSLGPRFKVKLLSSGLNKGKFYGTTFIGAGTVQATIAGVSFVSCNFDDCDTISLASTSEFRKCNVSNAITSGISLTQNPAKDKFRDINIQNCPIGITVPTSIPGGILELQKIEFLSNTNDIEVTGAGSLTIQIKDGGSIPTNILTPGGASVTVIGNVVNTTITVVDGSDGSFLSGVRVLVEASSASGSLPFNEVVSITRVGIIATVTHTSHGMLNGDTIVVRGANEADYNGVYVISNKTNNTYEYTVANSPTTPATGTIVATGVVISGVTDSLGQIVDTRSWASIQPVKGVARKSSASPRFKSGAISGTISPTVGLTTVVQLVIDQ